MGKTVKTFAVNSGEPLTDEEKQQAGEAAAESFNKTKELLESQATPKADVDIDELIKSFPWTPHQDRVVIYPDPAEYVLPSGIIIPDSVTERPQTGRIIALGDEISISSQIIEHLEFLRFGESAGHKPKNKTGDRVLFGKYAGLPIQVNGVDYLIMRYADIMSTLR